MPSGRRRARPGRSAARPGRAARAPGRPCRRPRPRRRRRCAERLDVLGEVGHQQQRAVPAGDQHRDRRLGQRPVLQLVDGDVRGEVVDAVERLVRAPARRPWPPRRRPAARRSGRARRSPRPRRCRRRHAGVGERPVHRRHHRLEVRPGGDLGDDAAEALVLGHRRGQRVGQQGVPAHEPDAGLVAGRLEPQDQRLDQARRPRSGGAPARASRFITTASAPLGW